ncbi:MAG: glycosyltransferase family 1 protein [Verrucomicrobia bacterium]|nr:glycosyltransferase family 1 protein [Verrucomicrobiota bacterium]MDA1085698.1 glycosyltransferase family 1 protein [Verrucomicrobiota bacterium]
MKIAFDGRAAQRPAHSYRRVLELLVLAARDVELDVELWADGELHPECASLAAVTRALPTDGESRDASALWTPAQSVMTYRDGVTVSTVCDVNPLLPDGRNPIARWVRARRFRSRVEELGAASWRVATDSEDAGKRLASAFPAHAAKLRVVPLFAHPSLQRLPDRQRDDLLRELELKAGYIFFVGSFRRHKNWMGLMKAYAMCPQSLRRDYPLVFSGPVHRDLPRAMRLMASLGITDTVRILGETPERYMAALYSGAELFAFPTLMEGFGLPPLEAMQCGVPVIASDRTAVPEVLGEAARYIDPTDLRTLAEVMQEVLGSRGQRESMAQAGLARAAQFGPRRTGEAILKVLREHPQS